MANRSLLSANGDSTKPKRASISFPIDAYAKLEQIAKNQKVSVAWIVRDAVEDYLHKRNLEE